MPDGPGKAQDTCFGGSASVDGAGVIADCNGAPAVVGLAGPAWGRGATSTRPGADPSAAGAPLCGGWEEPGAGAAGGGICADAAAAGMAMANSGANRMGFNMAAATPP